MEKRRPILEILGLMSVGAIAALAINVADEALFPNAEWSATQVAQNCQLMGDMSDLDHVNPPSGSSDILIFACHDHLALIHKDTL